MYAFSNGANITRVPRSFIHAILLRGIVIDERDCGLSYPSNGRPIFVTLTAGDCILYLLNGLEFELRFTLIGKVAYFF